MSWLYSFHVPSTLARKSMGGTQQDPWSTVYLNCYSEATVPSEVPEDAVKNTRMWLEKGPYRGRQLDTGVNIVAVVLERSTTQDSTRIEMRSQSGYGL